MHDMKIEREKKKELIYLDTYAYISKDVSR